MKGITLSVALSVESGHFSLGGFLSIKLILEPFTWTQTKQKNKSGSTLFGMYFEHSTENLNVSIENTQDIAKGCLNGAEEICWH